MFEIDDLKDAAVRARLEELIDWLNKLDEDDFFGTEGWKHNIGWED